MQIVITSGKGGVGKTFVAASLAKVLSLTTPVTLIDCDVEAPNASLFLKPQEVEQTAYMVRCITSVDTAKCTFCGDCSEACYYNAIAVGKKTATVFSDMCRWCGVCLNVCRKDALVSGERKIGDVYKAKSGNIELHWAALAAGAGGMSTKLIRHIKKNAGGLTILDSAPGTSCAVVATLENAQRVVLVSDATRFGIHDLQLSYHLCCSLGIKPFVIINRSGLGCIDKLRKWCDNNNIEILGEIPDNPRIAQLYSDGILAVDHIEKIREIFEDIAVKLLASEGGYRYKPQSGDLETVFLSPVVKADVVSDEDKKTSPDELVVISGKGGTGKTSIAACFSQLSGRSVVDCDVDAADMHLLLAPEVIESDNFEGGRVMNIIADKCIGCGRCIAACSFEAISRRESDMRVVLDGAKCEGCGNCMIVCPLDAIEHKKTFDGRWYYSKTRFGMMTHATLIPARENSGRLVSYLRAKASLYASAKDRLTILDGSPGTGCPVIASLTGAKAAVVVTEPTVSGLADMIRVLELARHFSISAGVIINKFDINESMADKICRIALEKNAVILGSLRYNRVFVDAQQEGKTVIEYDPDCVMSGIIKEIWKSTLELLEHKEDTNE